MVNFGLCKFAQIGNEKDIKKQSKAIKLNDLLKIWLNSKFQRLWITGTSSGIARWIEVMCFSVFAWQITKDATIAGYLMTLRLTGVLISSFLFLFIGGRVSGQVVMIVMHLLLGIICCLGINLGTNAHFIIPLFSFISFFSGVLWSSDFSFRRRMLGDRLPISLVGKGLAIDVMSSHATRLLAMLIGGMLIASGEAVYIFWLLFAFYVGPIILLWPEKDELKSHIGLTSTLKSVLAQAKQKQSIILVLCITPIFNIFALPYLALIAVIFLERFEVSPYLAGVFTSLEGAGAIMGGLLISIFQPKNFQLTFIVALTALLVSIFLIGCFPFVIGSVIILFFAGMMSSIYSSMQSTLIYVASKIELRSPTFSLMTMAIGSGSIGALNVAWMGNYFSVSELVMIMALEGIIFLFIILVIILYLGKNILKTN